MSLEDSLVKLEFGLSCMGCSLYKVQDFILEFRFKGSIAKFFEL